MNATEDLTPIITVDWDAVEDELGREIDDDLRGIIEHEGSTTSIALDKWGRADDRGSSAGKSGMGGAMNTSPDDAGTAELDHAALGVSVCEECESPSMNVIREQDGRFVIRCARCETTLVDPFSPPGADGKNSRDGEQGEQR